VAEEQIGVEVTTSEALEEEDNLQHSLTLTHAVSSVVELLSK
jgi:hypothetical protein